MINITIKIEKKEDLKDAPLGVYIPNEHREFLVLYEGNLEYCLNYIETKGLTEAYIF